MALLHKLMNTFCEMLFMILYSALSSYTGLCLHAHVLPYYNSNALQTGDMSLDVS